MSTAALSSPRTPVDYTPTDTYQLVAPTNATTPRVAREFITAVLTATGYSSLIDNACICLSDVVANVVLHARVPVLSVECVIRPGRVFVAVRDDAPTRRPYRRQATAGDESGRGLALVHGLSYAHGVTLVWEGLSVTGKRVWFELREEAPAARLRPDDGSDLP
ncbi:ATP-binding protein [Streptomyces sp. NPDC026206]|uniref:ATP-binding protein n=1 Tax=Streptomyces sp. NPDC026206 TaxID=3157089 RepID=UPI003411708C